MIRLRISGTDNRNARAPSVGLFLLSLAALAVVPALTSATSAAPRPNLIVIMADDLGYGDVSSYGATEIETPNIDRLAAEGIRFTDGYCSASTCTPTRFSFLTGMYAFRRDGTGIAPPNGPAIIDPSMPTFPKILQRAGYRTAVVGKWHLGLGEKGRGPDWNGDLKPGPLEIGFDYCFLLPTTNDRVPQVYVENHRVLNLDPADPLWVGNKKPSPDHLTGLENRDLLRMDWSHGHNGTIHNGISRIGFYTGGNAARFRDEDLADKWVEKSIEWMEENRDRPFFLFFASHDIHVPRMPHERFQGKSKLGYRGDAILELDWSVGQLMAALKRLDLEENTLVVFCSDNGPVLDDGYKDDAIEKNGRHRSGGGLKGGKYSVYEGGTRTPFIARWTGTIKPGESSEVVCTIDLGMSLASLAGASVAEDALPDSFDISGALLGKPGARGRDHLVQQDNGNRGNFGFRSGKWKLTRHESGIARNTVVEQELANTRVPRIQLFDLEKDPAETTNLAEEQPEIARRLERQLDAIIERGRSRSS